MEYTTLQYVAALSYQLGDGDKGLQKTAGFFNTMYRVLRSPFRGPLRQIGKDLSERAQQTLTSKVQQHALAAADPRAGMFSRWYNNMRGKSLQKDLGKELGLYGNLLSGEAKGISSRIDQINQALKTPGLTLDAQSALNSQLIRYKQQLKRLEGGAATKAQQSGTLLDRQQAYEAPTATPKDASTPEQVAAGTEAGKQAADNIAGAKPAPTPPPGTMPAFFEKYSPGTMTRNVANYVYADPLKATALGLGGLWGLNNVVNPTVKNVLGVQER